MDQEIDLRPYMIAVLRRWRLIISITLIFVLIGLAAAVMIGNPPGASANVLISPSSSQITLDPRFQTTNSSQATNPVTQRQALIDLARDQSIAQSVLASMSQADSSSGDQAAQALLRRVSVSASSDLLRITVQDQDPDRALALAKAWGQSFESMVADIYGRSPALLSQIDRDLADARQRYDAAQKELETFVSDGQLDQAQSEVAQISDLLDGSLQAQQLLYTEYLTRTRELDLILADAQTLRDQASAQSPNGFAQSFAALLLRARTVTVPSGGANSAPTFQISAADLSGDGSPADLDQLIDVLQQRRAQLIARSNQLAGAIADGSATDIGLDGPTRQRYTEQLGSLRARYERLKARKELLSQQRDLALDTLILLQKKRDEQQIASGTPPIEVRFVSAAIDPHPSILSRAVLSAVAGGVVGLVFGVMLALLLDIFLPALRSLSQPEPARRAPHNDAPADQAMPGD